MKKYKNVILPKFPKKKVFKNDKTVKEDRRRTLHQYFKGLCGVFEELGTLTKHQSEVSQYSSNHVFNVELLYDDEFWKFIEIEPSIRNYLIEDYSSMKRTYEDDEEESSSHSNSADFLADYPADKEIR